MKPIGRLLLLKPNGSIYDFGRATGYEVLGLDTLSKTFRADLSPEDRPRHYRTLDAFQEERRQGRQRRARVRGEPAE